MAKIILTQEQESLAIEMASEGKSIEKILEALCIGSYPFWEYREQYLDFQKRFEQARQNGLEVMADKLIDLADDMTIDVHRARLKSDNAKWLLSKRKPQIYGDKLDLNINQVVDIGGALGEAISRARLRDAKVVEHEVLEGSKNMDAYKIPRGEKGE